MKKFLTFLFAFLASIGLMNAEQVTLTWALDTAGDSQLSGTSTAPNITVSNVTYGSNLTPAAIKNYNEGKGTMFTSTDTSNHTSPVADGKQTLTFAFSIPKGYSFIPTNITFFSAADGTDKVHYLDAFFNDEDPFLNKYTIGRGSKAAETKSVNISDIELNDNSTLKFNLYGQPGSATKGWSIGNVVITGELVDLSDTRDNANISWDIESTTLKIRDAFTAPVLNNPNTLPVTFGSNNEDVATVDENGKITLVGGTGTARISATYDGGDEGVYKPTTANTTIEVVTNVVNVAAWEEYEKVESIPLTKLYTADKTSGTLAAGNLINDDFITIASVADANFSNYGKEFLGNKFSGTVQLGRAAATPSEGNLTGGGFVDKESYSSPVIVSPTVDCKVVMFIRRQSLSQRTTEDDDVANNVITRTTYYGMAANDDKSVYASPHSAIDTKLDQKLVFGDYVAGGTSYMYCAIEWDMKAGETYTLWTTGTTIAMQGIGYYIPTADYILRYVDEGGNTLKEVKRSGFVGSEITLEDTDLVDFTLTKDEVSTKYTYVSNDFTEGLTISAGEPVVVTITMKGEAAKAPNVLYSWDFTKWSEATVNNLKAGENWSDIEKAADKEPSETSKDNCFWQVSSTEDISPNKYVKANNNEIEELKGLVYINETSNRSLAIAVGYPSTNLGEYHGPSYLWLGGKNIDYFKIPNVPAGATIKMGVESHNTSDARGVKLSIAGEELLAPNGEAVAVPTTYAEQEWFVPTTAAESNDVLIRNTNGCHIYYITVTHPDVQKYTIRYVAGNETIKEVTKIGTPNAAITLTDEDKAKFTVTENGFSTEYTYDSDNSEGMTIVEDGKTVVTITMLKGMSIPTGYMVIPGELDITNWKYEGTLKLENDNTNVGCIKKNNSATGDVYVTEPGVYSMNIDFYVWKAACDIQIEITDQESGTKEIDTYYHIANQHKANILLEGNLTVGKKTIKYTFHSEADGYLVNYKNHTLSKVGESYAALKSVTTTAEGVKAVETEGYDYSFNIPLNYVGNTVTLNAELINAALSVKAGETEIQVPENGIFELPVPDFNEESEAVLTLSLPDEGAYAAKTEFKLRLFHIGDKILSGLTIDGIVVDEATVASIQENKTGEIEGYVFTTLPTVEATFLDGSVEKATGTLAEDKATATYTFAGTVGEKTENYSFTLSGFNIYQKSDNDNTEVLKYDSKYKNDTFWDNGRYFISCNDGWEGTQFKMKSANPVTLTTPNDMIIKQIKMVSLFENTTGTGKVASVTSEGATIYLPSASAYPAKTQSEQAIDLVINVENHVAGTPFVITFEGGSQPVAWFEFTYEQIKVSLDSETTLEIGKSMTLEATVTPASAPAVTWTSSNPDVATVDASTGVVTAKGKGKAVITASCGATASCTVICYVAGDASGDGIIAVNDAVNIANYIVGDGTVPNAPDNWNEETMGNWEKYYLKAADVNGDETVSVSDASATVQLMLQQNNNSANGQNKIAAYNDAADKLVVGGLTAANGASSVAVTLGNTTDYVALQADIFVPEGVNFEVKPGSRIAGSHSFSYHRFDANHMRIAIYNFGGKTFADNDEALFEIVADSNLMDAGEIMLTNVLASDAAAKPYVLGARYEDTTGVSAFGIDGNAPMKVYDLNGRYISDKVEGLAKGIYIIRQGDNVKKVNIR